MKKLIPLLLSVTSLFASGQVIIKGKVVNEKTKEPLAFVNITVKNLTIGTTSDIDGRFQLTVPHKDLDIRFSYIGFEPKVVVVTEDISSLLIKLKEKPTELKEVVVRPGENPAFRIIKQATKNKPINDPENLLSFTYNAYNKLYSTLLDADTTFTSDNVDSVKFKKYLHENHLFVVESYTERKYIKPNLNKEVVLGNHWSGLKDPFVTFVETDLQPLSFYKDFISLFGKDYLNPLSTGSTNKYDFVLIDTLYQNSDSVFVISFEPLAGKVFDGLKGQLYITTDGYAIQSVHAQPADDKVLVESLIQQQYEKIDGHWFPIQLNSELRFKKFSMQKLKLKYVSHSYITNVKIGDDLNKKNFGVSTLEFAPQAGKQDEAFWKINRAGEFDQKEKNTFHVLDSVGEKYKSIQALFKILEGFYLGRFKAGPLYLPIEYLVQVNQYEGTRIGFGFQTGEKISKRFGVEGYGGYGFKDKAFKYGGAFQVNVSLQKEAYFKLSYRQDIMEPGKPGFIKSAVATRVQESTRNWMAARMDSIEQIRMEFSARPFHFSQICAFAQQTKRNPTYDYAFLNNDNSVKTRFNIFEAGLQWRFAPRETYLKIGQSQIVTAMTYPQLNISLTRSFAGLLNGEYDYTKVEVRADHQFVSRGIGKITFQLASGLVNGSVPYPFLFNGKGSRFDQSFLNNVMIKNYFQTMGLYEFFSDRYAYLFLNQHVGRITGNKSKHFRPELSLVHNMGIGSLANKNLHEGVEFKTMEKGYFESGLTVANLIRFSYVDLIYFGIGAGGFYRYGNYSLPNASDNFGMKFVITFSF